MPPVTDPSAAAGSIVCYLQGQKQVPGSLSVRFLFWPVLDGLGPRFRWHPFSSSSPAWQYSCPF